MNVVFMLRCWCSCFNISISLAEFTLLTDFLKNHIPLLIWERISVKATVSYTQTNIYKNKPSGTVKCIYRNGTNMSQDSTQRLREKTETSGDFSGEKIFLENSVVFSVSFQKSFTDASQRSSGIICSFLPIRL